jgi:hypothetical protein
MTTYRFTNVPTTHITDVELSEPPHKYQLFMFPWKIGRIIFRVMYIYRDESPAIVYITENIELTEDDTTIRIIAEKDE